MAKKIVKVNDRMLQAEYMAHWGIDHVGEMYLVGQAPRGLADFYRVIQRGKLIESYLPKKCCDIVVVQDDLNLPIINNVIVQMMNENVGYYDACNISQLLDQVNIDPDSIVGYRAVFHPYREPNKFDYDKTDFIEVIDQEGNTTATILDDGIQGWAGELNHLTSDTARLISLLYDSGYTLEKLGISSVQEVE